jgi:integrator complex subunit 1
MKFSVGQSPLVGKRNASSCSMPQLNIRVLAAAILFAALEPLDHWPVQLIEAYAEDSFGPRSWVDDPGCQLLVQNLSLVHNVDETKGEDGITNDNIRDADAFLVAEHFRTLKEKQILLNTTDGSAASIIAPSAATSSLKEPAFGSDVKRRGSLSSSATSTDGVTPIFPTTDRKRSISNESESIKKSPTASPLTKGKQLSVDKLNNKTSPIPPNAESTISQTVANPTDNGMKKPPIMNILTEENIEDSDSGEEEVAVIATLSKPSDDGDGSSSSGEDEEILMDEKSADGSEMASGELGGHPDLPPPDAKLTFPFQQMNLNFTRIRQRYFGLNLEYSHLVISEKLNERLDIKSKQNSGLLQCLPSFTSIPSVRTLITGNLEKWLQSPALSGLARSLFSITVNDMKNADPPLPADLDALDNILRMRLKANQFNAHVENVTAIATKMPTLAVAKYIYGHLLRELLVTLDSPESTVTDHLAMLQAVHGVLPDSICAEGIASSLMDLFMNPPDDLRHITRERRLQMIRGLLRTIAIKLGSSFDAYEVLRHIVAYRASESGVAWTIRDEEDKARLLFQCATLVVTTMYTSERIQVGGKSIKIVSPSPDEIASLRVRLMKTRKMLLQWLCSDYCLLRLPRTTGNYTMLHPNDPGLKKNEEIVGAGLADYSSILDGMNDGNFPDWLNVVRCVLFMEPSDSPRLKQFLLPDGAAFEHEDGWEEEAKRINYCCNHGADLDDEMLMLLLNPATQNPKMIEPEAAILILEHLFDCCRCDREPCLSLNDPSIVSTLYLLVEYIPTVKNVEILCSNGLTPDVEMKDAPPMTATTASSTTASSTATATSEETNGERRDELNSTTKLVARLAYPGLWWRVTGLALIICGASPETVGAMCWDEYPTLKVLMKMVTSDRYWFPTVDCDDTARELQKKTEQEMRDEEGTITELLFLPQKKPKKHTNDTIDSDSLNPGSRTSRRQQEKREKMLKKQKEKEEAEAHAETIRRRKVLKTAQKSILLWDPKKGPRKPPKESADLIFSIVQFFDLPRTFQKCTNPDFVLATIGSTTRGAIERAYNWLIPIISFLPDTISRLPASASCFLLLRAIETEGEEQSQLQELSAPLLEHVHDSLIGEFGEANAIRAFDLLLTDIASPHPDRRSCARKVLQIAIGDQQVQEVDHTFHGSNHSWMLSMMHVLHAGSILNDAMKYLGKAASFERGSNLRYLILALNKITHFALDNDIDGDWRFAPMLVDLISRRPAVFAAALTSFSDLRFLAVHVVLDEFSSYVEKTRDDESSEMRLLVEISLCGGQYDKFGTNEFTKVILPLGLLQSACVLLSIWFGDSENTAAISKIKDILEILMKSHESDGGDDGEQEEADKVHGLASARFVESQKSAISVESWVMLANSRSDFIAKRAALAAPSSFLPRLLLCSGLPRASLFSMVDRLGRLGEKSSDRNKTFSQLMVPSASSEWDIGRLGQRKDVARKLLGRLSAYSRMYGVPERKAGAKLSVNFIEWLSETCSVDKSTKQKVKKGKASTSKVLSNLDSAGSLLGSLPLQVCEMTPGPEVTVLEGDSSEMTDFCGFEDRYVSSSPNLIDNMDSVEKFVGQLFSDNKSIVLDTWLEESYARVAFRKRHFRRRNFDTIPTLHGEEIALLLLNSFIRLERKVEGLASCLLKWIPKLSAQRGMPKLWTTLFAKGQKPAFLWDALISQCCQTWSHNHCIECREFLLSQGQDDDEPDLVKVVRFLVNTSNFSAVHVESVAEIPVATEDSAWARSEDTVRSATRIALDCLVNADYESRLRSRNDMPDSIALLLLIARIGRNQVQFVCGAIVDRLHKANGSMRTCLLLCLLRLYAYFPFSMNLGKTIVRSFLIEAVRICSEDWLTWRSPLDDPLENMLITALSSDSLQRSAQALCETAKKHPLLFMRKLDRVEDVLEKDAVAIDENLVNESLGIIVSASLDGPIQAQVRGTIVKVNVLHWGYSYRESNWFVVLDAVSAVPNEVLFGCGLRMGLIQLLEVYIRLTFVQSQLRTNERFLKLKAKFTDLLENFKVNNVEAWDEWLHSASKSIPSLGSTRNVLVRCGLISEQYAIDHVKMTSVDSLIASYRNRS